MVATKRRFDPNLQRVRIDDDGTPRRVYVCTRCLKAGKVTKAVVARAPGRRAAPWPKPASSAFAPPSKGPRAAGVPARGGQRPQRVPGRRRRHRGQHGAHAQRRAQRARPPVGPRTATIDEIGREEIVDSRRPRRAARRARQLRRDPLPAHPRRRRGARLAGRASSSTRCWSARRWPARPTAPTAPSATPRRGRSSRSCARWRTAWPPSWRTCPRPRLGPDAAPTCRTR